MAIITEQVHEHSYRSQPDDGNYYVATLSVRVDDVTRVVSAFIATNPGPRDVRVVIYGPNGTQRTDQVVPKGTPTITQNLPVGRRITLTKAADGSYNSEYGVSMSEV